MIAYLKGTIYSKQQGSVILDVGGVGYLVRISHHTLDRVPGAGTDCTLHIHHHISDNDQQLFGFASTEERNLFEMLITVKSIGPRLALALLSAMPPRQIVSAIVSQNAGLIARSPGIGKKSAERIVLELRDKLGDIVTPEDAGSGSGTIQNETISALEALGYQRAQAQKAVQTALGPDPDAAGNVSELLKKALKHL
ncbi:MAG: Holliday junction branch migration protein RuvA [Balneolaceae bacterium]|nr:MAG: Holliday junction branch migration protein RuvA [Balneolaceae bacterium]